MKNYIKKIIIFTIIIIGGIGVYLGNKKLKDEKRWFYSTGTNEVVFGDITWGMSQQEVERVLGEKLSNNEYKSNKFFQVVETEINYSDIKNGNFIFENSDESKNYKTNFEIKYSKPIKDFFGVESGNIIYKFYKNKLFCVVLFSSIESDRYQNYKTDFQYSIEDTFKKKREYLESNLIKSLVSRYGKLDIRELNQIKLSNEQEEFAFVNKINSNCFLDGTIGHNGFENFLLSNCWLKLRYKPIIEEINKDIKETETSFFK